MADELTEEKIADLKELFDVFDQNKDGKIQSGELSAALRSLGHDPTEALLKTMMNVYDTDRNGVITFPEFIVMVTTKL